MPIELSSTSVAHALARLGEHDLEAPRDVEAALELIAGREDDEAPVDITRYELQLFLWYQLPRKLLAPLEVKEAVAERLGRFLSLLGEGAAPYAAICTSEQTMRMLRAWEEEPSAGEQLQEALQASGLQPPDTDVLRWRSVMGFEEACLHDRVALELERGIEEGQLEPGARGFKRQQVALVAEFLRRPQAELGGRAPLEVIAEERLERWVGRGGEERRKIVGPVAPMLLTAECPGESPPGEEEPMAPLLWLLDSANGAIALTQTGALNRALVRAFVERFPRQWNSGAWGPPHREDEVSWLCELHDLARQMRLLRKTGRRLLLTRRGESLLGDPAALCEAVAPHLIAAEGFAGAVQELAVAVLLDEAGTVDRDRMQARVHAAIVADGWNAAGELPSVQQVGAFASGAIRLAEALELIVYKHEYDHESRWSRRELKLTPAGREALRLGLRSRALG